MVLFDLLYDFFIRTILRAILRFFGIGGTLNI